MTEAYLLGAGITGGCSNPGMWVREAGADAGPRSLGSETHCLRPKRVTPECTRRLAG